jgi:3-deoxy-manno-octulosonate cytidylyltransferase (CMP-KDO synthetase)
MGLSAIAVIPARLASTRLPGKVLLPIGDKPMIQHVYERTGLARGISEVVIATEDRQIFDAATAFGARAVLTGSCPCGTDRVAEVAEEVESDLVLNVQGDLPFIEPATLEAVLALFSTYKDCLMATACTPIRSAAEFENPNVVKVVFGREAAALYFSRSPIPFHRFPQGSGFLGLRHIGVYAYRRAFLLEYRRWPQGRLECTEGLEQLRALEAGVTIRVAVVDNSGIEVDTAEDLERARRLWEASG